LFFLTSKDNHPHDRGARSLNPYKSSKLINYKVIKEFFLNLVIFTASVKALLYAYFFKTRQFFLPSSHVLITRATDSQSLNGRSV